MQEKTWYEILEVPKNASKELIKAQYKKLSLKYHPDKNPQGEEKFKEISNAYEKAMDPSLKNAPAGFSFSSSTYSYGAKFKEHERGDVEEFLRSIIGAINPLKKDIPIEFRQSIVYMGGEWMGAQVLTDTEAHIFIVAFEYLVDQIIQPVTSSALGNVGQKNYIQQLKSRLMNDVVTFDHPIYRTFVPRSFYVENELLRFYLPIILESADTLKKIIKEMQLVMSWSNGLSEELAVSKELKEYLCIASPKYKERKEGLILSISIYDKGIDSLYKYLTKKIPNIRKYPVKQIKDRISINIPCEELNKIHIEWPICEKRKLVYRLQIAIDANDEKKVENLLIETAKQIDGDALKSIFNQLIQKTDIKLEIVKTLTQSLQGLMNQDFKDEIFINAVGESPVIIIKFFYSEFKPTSIFQRDIGTVAHNFARRFCGFCRSVEFDYFSDVKHFYFGDETVSKCNEEKRYGKGLNELIEIREIIKPMLEDCKQIKDKLGRTPAAYYKQYKRKTVFKQFLTLDAEKISNQEELAQDVEKKQIAAFLKFKEWVGESRLKRIESEQADKELKAKLEEQFSKEIEILKRQKLELQREIDEASRDGEKVKQLTAFLKLQKERAELGAIIGLLAGCVTLYRWRETANWPQGTPSTICFVAGCALAGGALGCISASTHPAKER